MTLINHEKDGEKYIITLKCDNCEIIFNSNKVKLLNNTYHFCCTKCTRKSFSNGGKLRELINSSNMEKYGTIHAANTEESRKKREQTNIERYNAPTPLMNKEIQEKAQKTNIERYGSKCSLLDPEINKKRIKTWNDKYGEGIKPLQNSNVRGELPRPKGRGFERSLSSPD